MKSILGYVFPPWARVAIIVALALTVFGYGVHIGKTLERGSNVGAEHKAEAALDRRDAGASDINASSRQQGAAQQVSNEGDTHARQERIRTIYVDHPVGADCRQPDGVSAELDAAVSRANDRVRAAAGAAAAPDPEGAGVPRH